MEDVMDRETAVAFVEGHGRTWQAWDLEGFADLFTDDVVYVEHPTDETVVGHEQMLDYIGREQIAAGAANVRMGSPIVEGDCVVGEFWTTMSKPGEQATLIGCFIAQLDSESGRCRHFRQYWHEVSGHVHPYPGWGVAT
jgi:ketosteroid isomerase-like protein